MATDELAAFGIGVRALREGRGWTQEKLAEMSELDQTYISGIERGQRNLGYRNLAKLARAFGDSRVGARGRGRAPSSRQKARTQTQAIDLGHGRAACGSLLSEMAGSVRSSGYDTNLAAEFYVLSCLHRIGLTANLTLGNNKGEPVPLPTLVPDVAAGSGTIKGGGTGATNPRNT